MHTQQTSTVQLLGMINASHQVLNHSSPPLVSDCWICIKPGSVQYLGVLLNQCTMSPPTLAPGTSDYPFLAPLPLYGNSCSPITGPSQICVSNNTFLACDQGVYACITLRNQSYTLLSLLPHLSVLPGSNAPLTHRDLLAAPNAPSQPFLFL